MSFIDTKNNFEKRDLLVRKVDSKPTTYSIGDHLFQLNSYTDEANKKAGHASQTLQFDTEGLKDLQKILQREFPELNAETSQMKIEKVKVSLLDKNGEPQYGLNWGQRTGREPNQAYVQLPIEVYRSDFFPKKPEHFFIYTDDGQNIKFTRAQKTDEGTALQTPDDNSFFGKYLRDRLSIPHGQEIKKEDILNYGCTELTIFKINNEFYMDFSRGIPQTEKSNRFTTNTNLLPFNLSTFTGNDSYKTRYITALLAKPFVILTGNSGTGKTKIATDFAKWLEKKTDTGFTNHLTVPVGADWTDNSKILGYFNPLANNGTGEYVKTEILTLIEAANDNPDIPFFLILDEMNLSHVERYFADFLSAMESGKPILLYKKPENCESTVPEKIYLPKNLFVTGTVNIDETTYMFSPKVLDRANVIEFKPEQDNVLSLLNKKSGNTDIVPDNNGMAEAFMNLANDVRTADYDFSDEKYKPLSESFKSLYDILEPSGFEFAYRTTKEIALYVSVCQKLNSDFKLMESIDEQLLQKILPKVHGNRKQIGNLLEKLETFCAEKSLSLSLAKVQKMKVRLENYQYASFI